MLYICIYIYIYIFYVHYVGVFLCFCVSLFLFRVLLYLCNLGSALRALTEPCMSPFANCTLSFYAAFL